MTSVGARFTALAHVPLLLNTMSCMLSLFGDWYVKSLQLC